MSLVQCMGGHCGQRDRCAHYTAPEVTGIEPSERLCERGHEEPEVIGSDERKRRMAADPRVAAWVAGAAE